MSKESFEKPYLALAQLATAIERLIGVDNETLARTTVSRSKELDHGAEDAFAKLSVSFAGREHTRIKLFSSSGVWIKHGKNETAFLYNKGEVQKLLVQVLSDYAVRKNVAIRFDVPTTGLLE